MATGRADTHHVVNANAHSRWRVAAENAKRASTSKTWEADQRHVKPSAVAEIMKLFEAMFVINRIPRQGLPMELKILPDGRRIALHPDCRDAVKSLTHWQRHAIFHQVCRQYYAKTHPNAAGDIGPLSTEGLDVVRRSLSAQEAASIADAITANLEAQGSNAGAHAPVSDDPRDVIINVAQTGDLRARLQDALPRILNDDTTALLERYYESHFRIHGALTYRTHALTRQVGSFLWHRDLAPMGQVHLIVYLTPSGVTSGSTQFLGLYQSAWAASLGYHYENLREPSSRDRDYFRPCRRDTSRPLSGTSGRRQLTLSRPTRPAPR